MDLSICLSGTAFASMWKTLGLITAAHTQANYDQFNNYQKFIKTNYNIAPM